MRRESDIKLHTLYVLCIFIQLILALRASPTTRSRSYRGLALREVDLGSRSLHSGDALTRVRWRPPLRWLKVVLVLKTTDRLDSPVRLLRSRSASPSGRSTGRSVRSRSTFCPKEDILTTASPFGEEEPGPQGAREGDTCLSPGVTQGRESGMDQATERSSATKPWPSS